MGVYRAGVGSNKVSLVHGRNTAHSRHSSKGEAPLHGHLEAGGDSVQGMALSTNVRDR